MTAQNTDDWQKRAERYKQNPIYGTDLNRPMSEVIHEIRQRSPDVRQRFTVQEGGRWIDDDDFIFDAMLKISGDFTPEDRLRFAQWIADTLNAADTKLPRVGRGA